MVSATVRLLQFFVQIKEPDLADIWCYTAACYTAREIMAQLIGEFSEQFHV